VQTLQVRSVTPVIGKHRCARDHRQMDAPTTRGIQRPRIQRQIKAVVPD
jgi:hypothetical protein